MRNSATWIWILSPRIWDQSKHRKECKFSPSNIDKNANSYLSKPYSISCSHRNLSSKSSSRYTSRVQRQWLTDLFCLVYYLSFGRSSIKLILHQLMFVWGHFITLNETFLRSETTGLWFSRPLRIWKPFALCIRVPWVSPWPAVKQTNEILDINCSASTNYSDSNGLHQLITVTWNLHIPIFHDLFQLFMPSMHNKCPNKIDYAIKGHLIAFRWIHIQRSTSPLSVWQRFPVCCKLHLNR